MNGLSQFVRDHVEALKVITPICALGVSAASIILTYVTLKRQQKHNFKTLTPVPNFLFSDYENHIAVKLRNAGIGPLLIEKFTASDSSKTSDDLISWVPSPTDSLSWATFTENIDGWCIAPNHEVVIIELVGDLEDSSFPPFRDRVRAALGKLTVSVIYKDIYDHPFPEKARSLEWFLRWNDEKVRVSPKDEANLVVNISKIDLDLG